MCKKCFMLLSLVARRGPFIWRRTLMVAQTSKSCFQCQGSHRRHLFMPILQTEISKCRRTRQGRNRSYLLRGSWPAMRLPGRILVVTGMISCKDLINDNATLTFTLVTITGKASLSPRKHGRSLSWWEEILNECLRWSLLINTSSCRIERLIEGVTQR